MQNQYNDFFEAPVFKPNDCEIVVDRQYRVYAESIETRLKNIGFRVDVLFLKDENLLVDTLDDISQRKCLYAMVITAQNEIHNSVTLYILHGCPQEHRSMPLDDALKLMARNFHEYLQNQREKLNLYNSHIAKYGTLPMPEPEVQLLLSFLANGRFLTISELEYLINYLEKQKCLILGIESKDINPAVLDIPGPLKEAVISKQLNLQPEVLDQHNPNLSSTDIPVQFGNAPTAVPAREENDPDISSTYINFSNPNVQKALDNLMQTGPSLLKNIGLNAQSNELSDNPEQNPDKIQMDISANQIDNSLLANLSNLPLGNINQPLLGTPSVIDNQGLLVSELDQNLSESLGSNQDLLESGPKAINRGLLGSRPGSGGQGLLGLGPEPGNHSLLGSGPDNNNVSGLLGSGPGLDNQNPLGSRSIGNNQSLLGSAPNSSNKSLLGSGPNAGIPSLLGSGPNAGIPSLLGSRPNAGIPSLLGSGPNAGIPSLLGPGHHGKSLLGSRPHAGNQSMLGSRSYNQGHRF